MTDEPTYIKWKPPVVKLLTVSKKEPIRVAVIHSLTEITEGRKDLTKVVCHHKFSLLSFLSLLREERGESVKNVSVSTEVYEGIHARRSNCWLRLPRSLLGEIYMFLAHKQTAISRKKSESHGSNAGIPCADHHFRNEIFNKRSKNQFMVCWVGSGGGLNNAPDIPNAYLL